jgi:hypothetical protein
MGLRLPSVIASPPPFVLGANLPWIRYGCDFGRNAWQPAGGLASSARLPDLRHTLERLASEGIRSIRWFMFCDGRAGIRFADDGRPLGLDDAVFPDVDASLDALQSAGLSVVFVLLDFHWCFPCRVVNGVALGGRRRLLQRPHASALVDDVLAPLLERYGRHQSIVAWDLLNEPEWATLGYGTWHPRRGIWPWQMRRFLATAAAAVRRHTRHAVTVGSASGHWLPLVQGLDLDFYQVHWYDVLDRRAPFEAYGRDFVLDRPVLLGEFPTRGSARAPESLAETACGRGFTGAFYWSVCAEDGSSNYAQAGPRIARWARDRLPRGDG